MTATKRTAGLGRGMASLIPMNDSVADTLFSRGPSATDVLHGDPHDLSPVPGLRLLALRPDDIRPNPHQPRRDFEETSQAELEHSVLENGVLQPIVVRPVPPGGAVRFELVMGERRLRAAKAVGLRTIPAVVKETADDLMLQEALLENLHRLQLNALEEASAYQQLIDDFGVSHDELAERLGRSRSMITNTIRLLGLPESIQRKVATGVFSAAHGRALLQLVDPGMMTLLAERIVAERMNVRQVEAAAAMMLGPDRRRNVRGQRAESLLEVSDRLGSRFDTRVQVSMGAKSGKIVIEFGSASDLNRILGQLGDQGWAEGEELERAFSRRAEMLRRAH